MVSARYSPIRAHGGGNGGGGIRFAYTGPRSLPEGGPIRGYDPHAVERIVDNTREDGGVSNFAIENAVEYPERITTSSNGARVYYGRFSRVVILDSQVTSATPIAYAGRRYPR